MVNASGAVADGDRYVYTPYGVQAPERASGQPFRYTGQRYDAEA